MNRKQKLEALFEQWLGTCGILQRAEAPLADSCLVDHRESQGEASCLDASPSVLAEAPSEDRTRCPGLQERRASDRVKDRATLLVMGEDAAGRPLSELASINDVGLGGISFFLTSSVRLGQVLELTLCSPEFGAAGMFSVQATVLRSVRTRGAVGPCLVAAEFKGVFATVNRGSDVDTTAEELRRAIQLDERLNHRTPS
jgi:hypothetical protein